MKSEQLAMGPTIIVIWLPCYDDGEYPFPIDPRYVVSFYPSRSVHISAKVWNKYKRLHKIYQKACMTHCSDHEVITSLRSQLKSLAENMRNP